MVVIVTTARVAAAPPPAPPAHAPKNDDLVHARALDKEGAKAYAEGRYADAIRFFEEAHRLGGPAFELWNVAKCHLRLDRPEQAAEMLERYLATPNLPKEDREEASQQLEALKKRPSTLNVSSTPTGAQVSVDGKSVEGKTPVTVTVAPGVHTVTVSSPQGPPYTKQVEARYGRSIVVEASPTVTETRPPPPDNPYGAIENPPLSLRAALGVVLPRYGSIGGGAGVGFTALGTYRVLELGSVSIAAGGLFSVVGDSWSNRTGLPNTAPNCVSPLHDPQSATAVSFFGIGTATIPLAPKLRAVAIGGVGIAGYVVDDVGGDLFVPSCTASPGVRPALLFGAQLDYAITSVLRLSAFPLTWQIQPAFDGARASPQDASGIWMRFGIGLGAGVDL
jgi:hypothetical protein